MLRRKVKQLWDKLNCFQTDSACLAVYQDAGKYAGLSSRSPKSGRTDTWATLTVKASGHVWPQEGTVGGALNAQGGSLEGIGLWYKM